MHSVFVTCVVLCVCDFTSRVDELHILRYVAILSRRVLNPCTILRPGQQPFKGPLLLTWGGCRTIAPGRSGFLCFTVFYVACCHNGGTGVPGGSARMGPGAISPNRPALATRWTPFSAAKPRGLSSMPGLPIQIQFPNLLLPLVQTDNMDSILKSDDNSML